MTDPTSHPHSPDEVRTAVRQRYGAVAASVPSATDSCCAPSCCGGSATTPGVAAALGYDSDAEASVPAGSNLGLGCGNPTGMASLRPGETVLDLGSGAGFDVFLAARAVGPTGRVIGVDMTPEMLHRAREKQRKAGIGNVEFRLGEIENLPVADCSVDVVLSNCVINLSPDKQRVFAEAFRVLRPGGRLAISDVVAVRPMPAEFRRDLELHTGCIAGAAPIEELEQMLAAAGFGEIRIEPKAELQPVVDSWFPARGSGSFVASATIQAIRP
jgi:arsenite methyltransferase